MSKDEYCGSPNAMNRMPPEDTGVKKDESVLKKTNLSTAEKVELECMAEEYRKQKIRESVVKPDGTTWRQLFMLPEVDLIRMAKEYQKQIIQDKEIFQKSRKTMVKEVPKGELVKTAVRDFKGNILETCSALQKMGNLTGPGQSMAAQVMILFKGLAESLGDYNCADYHSFKNAMVSQFHSMLESSLTNHERHYAAVIKNEKAETSPNVQSTFKAFVKSCTPRFHHHPAIESDAKKWKTFKDEYKEELKDLFLKSIMRKYDFSTRRRSNITLDVLAKNYADLDADLEQAARTHDVRVRAALEVHLLEEMIDQAFPLECISRRSKTKRQLQVSMKNYVQKNEQKKVEHSLHIRATVHGVISYGANCVVTDIRKGTDVLESLRKHFIEGPPAKLLSESEKSDIDNFANNIVEIVTSTLAIRRGDITWLQGVIHREIEKTVGSEKKYKKGTTRWKGFEEAWYKDKTLQFLCTSAPLYFLTKSIVADDGRYEEINHNAFLMKKPEMYSKILNLQVPCT